MKIAPNAAELKKSPLGYHFIQSCENSPSVYKIWIGDKFLIWKGVSLEYSPYHVAVDIERMMRNGIKPGHLLSKATEYMLQQKISEFKVEMLFQNEDSSELLKYEHRALQLAAQDLNCLNISFAPVIPKWIDDISAAEYDNWKSKL